MVIVLKLYESLTLVITFLIGVATIVSVCINNLITLKNQQNLFYRQERIKLIETKIAKLYAPFLQEYYLLKAYELPINRVNCGELFPYFDSYKSVATILENNIQYLSVNVLKLYPRYYSLINISNTAYNLENINDLSQINSDEDLSQHLSEIVELYTKISELLVAEFELYASELENN